MVPLSLTLGSWPSSEPTELGSWVRVSSQPPSLATRRKVSPSKQSSDRGNNFLLAKGSGWQHHSSTMAFQLQLGRGSTRLNTLRRGSEGEKNTIIRFTRSTAQAMFLNIFSYSRLIFKVYFEIQIALIRILFREGIYFPGKSSEKMEIQNCSRFFFNLEALIVD